MKVNESLNSQQIYDKVSLHLIKQGCQSYNPDFTQCQYRAGDLMCAVGCLIKDSEYRPWLEGSNIECPNVQKAVQASGVDLWSNFELLKDLQVAHDALSKFSDGTGEYIGCMNEPEVFQENIVGRLKEVARIHNLKTEVLA